MGFQAIDKQSHRPKTPVEFTNWPLPLAADPPPPPFWRYFMNTNSLQCTGYDKYLITKPLRNVIHPDSEHLLWGDCYLVRPFLTSLGRCDHQSNAMCVYFIVLGMQGPIVIWVVWLHGEVFQDVEMWDTVDRRFYFYWCLCETSLPHQLFLLLHAEWQNIYILIKPHARDFQL